MKKSFLELAILFVGVLLETLLLAYWQFYTFPSAKIAASIVGKQGMIFSLTVVSYMINTIISALIPVILYVIISSISTSEKDSVAIAPKTKLATYYYVNCLIAGILGLIFTYITHNSVPQVASLAFYYGGAIIQISLSYSIFEKRRSMFILFAVLILAIVSIKPLVQLAV